MGLIQFLGFKRNSMNDEEKNRRMFFLISDIRKDPFWLATTKLKQIIKNPPQEAGKGNKYFDESIDNRRDLMDALNRHIQKITQCVDGLHSIPFGSKYNYENDSEEAKTWIAELQPEIHEIQKIIDVSILSSNRIPKQLRLELSDVLHKLRERNHTLERMINILYSK